MTPEDIKAIIKALEGINEKLNFICTEGIFVTVDEDISEN